MKLSGTRWLALGIAAVVAADWFTKFWIANRIFIGGIRRVAGEWFYLTHRQNPGISFSWFADSDSPLRTPLLALAACVGIAVAAQILRTHNDGWVRIAAGLVIAGALGNLGDRLVNGAVTDFIFLHPLPFIFNIADVAITAGAVLLTVRLMREADDQTPSTAI